MNRSAQIHEDTGHNKTETDTGDGRSDIHKGDRIAQTDADHGNGHKGNTNRHCIAFEDAKDFGEN